MLSLWRGTIDCTRPDDRSTWDWVVLRGDVWQTHGQAVASAFYYLPTSFNRPPHNIVDKITSGYKAWEFLLYLYGLGPGLLYRILPQRYFTNYCKLILGIWLMNQHRITQENLCNAHLALLSFTEEFEDVYCQCMQTCIHFICPCMHLLVHLLCEVLRIGPPICSSQWTLERTIGNLGEEIKQHLNPFTNLSQRGIRRAHVNALIAIIPDLEGNQNSGGDLPHGSKDIEDRFVLLHARDKHPECLRECKVDALNKFLSTSNTGRVAVRQWARLRIPTGQVCYSAWKELQRPLEKCRTACNVKVCQMFCLLCSSHLSLPYT